jgi:hypothetical protein
MSKNTLGTLLVIGVGALGMGCGGVAPNVVYATGHDVEAKAKLAQADLATCKSDDAKCGPVESDLSALAEDGSQLQQAAVSAGYKP